MGGVLSLEKLGGSWGILYPSNFIFKFSTLFIINFI